MKENELILMLRRQAHNDYSRWCSGIEIENFEDFQSPLLKLCTSDLLRILDKLITEIPTNIEYDIIYCACVLMRNFWLLQISMNTLSKPQHNEMEQLFRFSRIFLNAGCFDKCIDCCNLCLSDPCADLLPAARKVELLFARSKSKRNLGEYQSALDDLCMALHLVEQSEDISYLKGAVLIRVGKVYSQFLMMMSVSLCFLHEAKDQLEPWLHSSDIKIREKVLQEYAICLDSIGQYWKEKGNPDEALLWFDKALNINQRLKRISGVFRTESHIIMTKYPQLLCSEKHDKELTTEIIKLQSIIRKLEDDHANQRGLAIRQLHLAEIQAQIGQVDYALYWLGESKKIARLYRDDKTRVKQKIVELKYSIFSGSIDQRDLYEILTLAELRKLYGYEIKLHDTIIGAIHQGILSNGMLLSSLNRNRMLYLQLSDIAQKTIEKISALSDWGQHLDWRDEFFYLSERNSKDLLVEVVHDYDLFINEMNKIISKLLQITEQRSKDLNKAILAEAKASLASGILHDLKHMFKSVGIRDFGEDKTCLDDVLYLLNHDYSELPLEKRLQLISPIETVNQNLKNKILPRILEATRVPNDFSSEINVSAIFSEVTQLRLEDSSKETIPVIVDCPDYVSIVYNREIFFNLIKEMYRNALDYHRKTQAEVVKYIMEAHYSLGEVEIRILSQFKECSCAKQAEEAISRQLREDTDQPDGFGMRALRGFMQFKTGGACTATVVNENNIVGIRFSVPRE